MLKSENALVQTVASIRELSANSNRVVFVSGDFNIVHPGHLRLLKFAAERGDFLLVGVKADGLGNSHMQENLRLEGVNSIGLVSHAFLLEHQPEEFIELFQPDVVVKGQEYAKEENPEEAAVSSYGGKLLFSSGDVRFSSFDLLQKEVSEVNVSNISKHPQFASRHGFKIENLSKIVKRFSELNVIIVGDLIVDEYITCDALGMSQEDPTVVVTPVSSDQFVGGAAIVAAHANGLRANTRFFTVAGKGEMTDFAVKKLEDYGVKADILLDDDRKTTHKQRYRASGKTLLRVNHLSRLDISPKLIDEMLEKLAPAIEEADVLIFSDFNYGCLPQKLVDETIALCKKHNVIMAADSQSSSQVGDISRFKGVDLVTPTEREARLGVHDFSSGLVVLADKLLQETGSGICYITLGQEGIIIHNPDNNGDELLTDRLPALNSTPKDVAGAGDSMLICSAMAIAVGADAWQSAYLGSVAAACQVSRMGNMPLQMEELVKELVR